MPSSLMNTSTCSPLKIEAKPSSPLHVNNNIITVPRRYSSSSSSIRCSLKSLRSEVERSLRGISQGMLNSFVDSTFRFEPQPYLPTQGNFTPVEEIGDSIELTNIEGEIPADFPEGVYIRNGMNSPFGALLSTHSMFGTTTESFVEGDGMLHAVYFTKDEEHDGRWNVRYKNKYVETDTFKIEKQRSRPSFLPVIEGESVAVLVALLLNQLRFGIMSKQFCNANVIEHAGRVFATSDYGLSQEISVSDLQSKGEWDVNGTWKHRGFTSHPKRVPATGELVITSTDVFKPYLILGIISPDGKKIMHEVDLGLERSIMSHDLGITERYNVILDMPMVLNVERLLQGHRSNASTLPSFPLPGRLLHALAPRLFHCLDASVVVVHPSAVASTVLDEHISERSVLMVIHFMPLLARGRPPRVPAIAIEIMSLMVNHEDDNYDNSLHPGLVATSGTSMKMLDMARGQCTCRTTGCQRRRS